jgi:hypothetical protein
MNWLPPEVQAAVIRRARRKAKLKMRFKGSIAKEIVDTVEKLELLREIEAEA